jgi:hypothetical protein
LERRRIRLSKYLQIMQNTRKKYEEQVDINQRMPVEFGHAGR